jgi:hypothetical protein
VKDDLIPARNFASFPAPPMSNIPASSSSSIRPLLTDSDFLQRQNDGVTAPLFQASNRNGRNMLPSRPAPIPRQVTNLSHVSVDSTRQTGRYYI